MKINTARWIIFGLTLSVTLLAAELFRAKQAIQRTQVSPEVASEALAELAGISNDLVEIRSNLKQMRMARVDPRTTADLKRLGFTGEFHPIKVGGTNRK